MRNTLSIFALGALLLAWAYAGEGTVKCDMKTVITAYHCGTCEVVLEKKDLVSDVTMYVCEDCEIISKTGGKCEACEEPLKQQKSDKDVCRQCLVKPMQVQACRKTYYACPDCEAISAAAGTCEDCDTALQQRVSLALVTYDCPQCGDSRLRAGKCEDKECKHFGKPLARTCAAAGEHPHVAK